MTGRSDITRWNRAGLRRFQYVDANAATYLEELRVRLAERFPLWQAVQRSAGRRACVLRIEASDGRRPDLR